uniref:Uncharacterized protein n=1 Tax=Lepeophtheirus salmonis TaxID=72036 RepID=A0A0K2VIC8_LEPSM
MECVVSYRRTGSTIFFHEMELETQT